jgi:hypothetical protein
LNITGYLDYLKNLEATQFISKSQDVLNPHQRKNQIYRVSDPFLIFLYKFVVPNLGEIEKGPNENLVSKYLNSKWLPWSGLAFERLININALFVAKKLEILDEVIAWGPLIIKKSKKISVQYDLVYRKQNDSLTLCEIKFNQNSIGTEIIAEFERKIVRSDFPKLLSIERVLICIEEPTRALPESKYFHQILTAKKLFS